MENSDWQGQAAKPSVSSKMLALAVCCLALAASAQASRELIRFGEDQFTCWERPSRADGACSRSGPIVVEEDAETGGRTRKTGFGVSDIVVHYFRNHIMLDTFDTAGMVDEKGNERTLADAAVAITYDDKEVDPVRYAGYRGRFIEIRGNNGGRELRDAGFVGVAHVVIAPDVLKSLKERELEPYPQNDFGGVYIGDKVTRADQSSKRDGDRRNSEKQFKRMVSRENVIVAKFEKREETAGFMTEHEDSPWIMLDLGKSQLIAGMVIDGYERGTSHLCVWVSDDGKHEKLVDKESLQCERYRIDLQKKNVKGRYIRIGREPKIEKNWFFLDKVVIYGKEK